MANTFKIKTKMIFPFVGAFVFIIFVILSMRKGTPAGHHENPNGISLPRPVDASNPVELAIPAAPAPVPTEAENYLTFLDPPKARMKDAKKKLVPCDDSIREPTYPDGDNIEIPDMETLKKMSNIDLQELYHRYVMNPQYICRHSERMGALLDGGWEICLDKPFMPSTRRECLVYSYGISYDFTFDDDMARFGCTIYSFDPSMYKAKDYLKRGNNIHFYKIGLGASDGKVVTEDKHIWDLRTLKTTRKDMGHEKTRIDFVKIDIEGAERTCIPKAIEDGALDDVRQLAFELHLGDELDKRDIYMQNMNVLRMLYKRGFLIYLTHRNADSWNHFVDPFTCKIRTACHELHLINTRMLKKQ